MTEVEQLSVLHVVSLPRNGLMEQDAKCMVKRKFPAVIFFVTIKLFKVDTKHAHIQCSLVRQCLMRPAFQSPA